MIRLTILLVLCGLTHTTWGAAPEADAFLSSGKFAEGIVALETHLREQPQDDNARLGLGVMRFVRAVQRLGQKMAVYGPHLPARMHTFEEVPAGAGTAGCGFEVAVF